MYKELPMPHLNHNIQLRPSNMVEGKLWYGIDPIFLINGIMKAIDYIEILQDVMLPYAKLHMPSPWIFQHDNDPKHTARITQQ